MTRYDDDDQLDPDMLRDLELRLREMRVPGPGDEYGQRRSRFAPNPDCKHEWSTGTHGGIGVCILCPAIRRVEDVRLPDMKDVSDE